jgi:hypothetical protein
MVPRSDREVDTLPDNIDFAASGGDLVTAHTAVLDAVMPVRRAVVKLARRRSGGPNRDRSTHAGLSK